MRMLPGFLLAATLVAASALGAEPASANLLVNPGFETGGGSYTGWFTFGTGVQLSTPGTDNIFRSGSAASKIYGGFVSCPGGSFNVGGYGQAFTPTAGRVYQMSGYTYVSSTDPMIGTTPCTNNRVLAKVTFFNAAVGGSEIASNELVIADGKSAVNQWNPFTVSAPAPAGALRVEALILYLQPACDTGSAFLDDLSFDELTPAAEPNVLANPSFSSGLTGWTKFGNVIPDTRVLAVRTPSGSVKMFSTFVNGNDSGIYQSFPTTPGSVWQLGAYAMTSCDNNDVIGGTNDNTVVANITFRDAANAAISTSQAVILDATASPGNWTRHLVTGTAPVLTASVDAFILFVSPTLQGGAAFVDDVSFQRLGTVGVIAGPGQAGIELSQNVPNPFGASTRIEFSLPAREMVEVGIYDVAGRRIASLLHASLDAGPHAVTWDGNTTSGRRAAPGIYQYVVRTGSGQRSRSMLLNR